jgi:alkylation response protein AidB-like acyl-CoA dehydrogenase
VADYKAPMEEYDFLLCRVTDAHLDATTGGDVDLDDVREILGHAGALASEVIEPLNPVGDHPGNTLTDGRATTAPGTPRPTRRAPRRDGWMGISLPREAGGDSLSGLVTARSTRCGPPANVAFPLGPGPSVGAAYALFASAGEKLKQQIRRPWCPAGGPAP